MENPVVPKSFAFAVRIVYLYKDLSMTYHEYVISKQILRAGTSIGANIAEAEHAQSRADYTSKLTIALKEADETRYWLRLLEASEFISHEVAEPLLADCIELIWLLASTVRSLKNNGNEMEKK